MLPDFKKLAGIVPGATIIVIYLFYWSLTAHYEAFGIEIYAFMNGGEILTYFFQSIHSLLAFLLPIVLMVLISPFEKIKPEREKQEYKPDKWYLFFLIFMGLVGKVFSIIDKSACFGFAKNATKIQDYWFSVSFIVFCLIISVIYLVSYRYIIQSITDNQKFLYNIFSVMLLGVIIGYGSMISAYISILHPKEQSLSFSYLGKHVVTNNRLIYVGETKDYLFLCKLDSLVKENQTIIFSKEKIDSMLVRFNLPPEVSFMNKPMQGVGGHPIKRPPR